MKEWKQYFKIQQSELLNGASVWKLTSKNAIKGKGNFLWTQRQPSEAI